MARHDQKPESKHLTCSNCHAGKCDKCIDVTRFLAGFEVPICMCKRQNHSGEPINNQILDPETKTVYGLGISVDVNGKVTRYGSY